MRALALALLLVCGAAFGLATDIDAKLLPAEARQTIALIKAGGPFPYSRDGVVFSNREAQLPKRTRGYYHEYTVKTPGARDRGARRIVTGRGGELYYTDDHYRTFKRVIE
jgi:ribonuclease T1